VSRAAHRRIAWAGFVLLLVLHMDFWRPRSDVRLLGWLPEEVLWRLGWMGLAACYLAYLAWKVWPVGGEEDER
jgi:hypothetical protein